MAERTSQSSLIEAGTQVLLQSEQVLGFLDDPRTLTPNVEIQRIIYEGEQIASSIADLEPRTLEDVYLLEMKRRMRGESNFYQTRYFSTAIPTWQEVLQTYSIPEADVLDLEDWLEANLVSIKGANERLRLQNDWTRVTQPALGIPSLRVEAEELVGRHINTLKYILFSQFNNWPGVSSLLQNWRIDVDSWQGRSYCNDIARVVGISTMAVTEIRDGQLFIRPNQILELFGHEVMGHARQYEVTRTTEAIPKFLGIYTGKTMEAGAESVAQYFESRFFDYLQTHPEAQKLLGFNEPFEKFYQRYKDSELLSEYWKNIVRFGIFKLAQNGFDNLQASADAMTPYIPYEGWFGGFLNKYRHDWDQRTGRLYPGVVSELRYCANPVKRVMERTPEADRAEAERLILMGYWTPIGLEQWVDINLRHSSLE